MKNEGERERDICGTLKKAGNETFVDFFKKMAKGLRWLCALCGQTSFLEALTNDWQSPTVGTMNIYHNLIQLANV